MWDTSGESSAVFSLDRGDKARIKEPMGVRNPTDGIQSHGQHTVFSVIPRGGKLRLDCITAQAEIMIAENRRPGKGMVHQ